MSSPGLSADVRRYAAGKLFLKLGGAAVWFASWGFSIWFYTVEWSGEADINMVYFASALSLIGIFIFGLPGLIFRKTVDGTVEERSVTEGFAPFTKGGDDENNRMIQTLKIKLDDGRIITNRCGNREDFIFAFAPGTRVRRHRLLRIPEPLDGEFAGRICLVCGGTADETGHCVYCERKTG